MAIDEVRASIDAFASRYLERVFTTSELRDCSRPEGGHDAACLAGRFAAKEAALKTLRAGDAAVPWTAVEVARLPDGAPELRLWGPAAALAARAGVGPLAVSIAHEAGLASAVVIAETTR